MRQGLPVPGAPVVTCCGVDRPPVSAPAEGMAGLDSEITESKSLDRVIADLEARFPSLPHDYIEGAVRDQYHAFDVAPVRDYIPVMVERGAKAALVRQTGVAPAHWSVSARTSA